MELDMILKEIDSKDNEINTLKKLLLISQSEKQKALISKDLKTVENGYKTEKENAYYLDFHFAPKDYLMLLHDIRLEHNGRTAQFDHLLIAPLGIYVLESKSFVGTLTIKEDFSLNVKYGKYTKTFPNPIEQNNRHIKVLNDFINDNFELSSRFKLLGGIPIENKVLIHPNTTVTNKKLPDGFERSDSFATKRNEEIDKMNPAKVLLRGVTYLTKDLSKEIAAGIIKAHTPVNFDYTKKYKVSKNEFIQEQPEQVSQEENKLGKQCPRCNEGTLVKRKRKSKKVGTQYNSDEFLGCNRFPKCRYTAEI